MNFPETKVLQTQSKNPLLFQTHYVSFEIGGKEYVLAVQTSAGYSNTNAGEACIDILDVVEITVDGQTAPYDLVSPGSVPKILKNIHSLFGREWYEKIAKEEAIKGWEQYTTLLNKPIEEAKWDFEQLISQIESDIDGYDYDQHVELEINENQDDIRITKHIDSNSITRDLIINIKHIVENFSQQR